MSPPVRLAAALAALYWVGAAIYSVVVPVFEGPDEREHFGFVRFVAQHWRIPDLRTEYGAYDREATQAPLFYFVAAAALQAFDLSDTSALPLTNPQATPFELDGYGNKNGFIHTPLEAWPFHDDVIRAIHVARLVSAAFGALAVAAAVLLGARHSLRVALLAGLLVGALPQFLFIGGLISNDAASAGLSGLGLLALARYWERPGRPAALLAGLALGLAVLAKVGGVWLLPLAAATVLWRRRRTWALAVGEGLLILLACLAVAGWWLGLNLVRYGDPTGVAGHLILEPGAQVDLGYVANLAAMVRETVYSFWAVFGGSNIAGPDWMYVGFSLLALAALAGLVVDDSDSAHRHVRWLCVSWAVLLTLAALAWMTRTRAWHGRLFFPALSAYAVLAAIGIDELTRRWRAARALYALPAGLLLLACLAPPVFIRPAYAPPRAVAALPTDVEPLCVQYEVLELLAVETAGEVQPGAALDVTFYWRMRQPITYDLLLFIRLLDGDLRPIAGDNTYPGQGTWPTKLWEPGVIYADHVRLAVDGSASSPTLARLTVLVDRYGEDVPATCDGNRRDPLWPLANVRVIEPQPQPSGAILLLGDTVALAGADWPARVRPGETLPVNLLWHVRAAPGRQLTRFVHLEHDGKLVAQFDAVPAGFPAYVWVPGDVLPDPVELALPDDAPTGTYTLRVGMYDADGNRLPNEAPDDRAVLGTVEVVP